MLTTLTAIIFLSAPAILPVRVEAVYEEQKAVVGNEQPQAETVEPISRATIAVSSGSTLSGFPEKPEYKSGCV